MQRLRCMQNSGHFRNGTAAGAAGFFPPPPRFEVKLCEFLSRSSPPTSICPANPAKSKKTAAKLATAFSVRCYLTMEGSCKKDATPQMDLCPGIGAGIF